MISCSKCNKPLHLRIDVKECRSQCSECGHEYTLIIKDNSLIIKNLKKQITIRLGGINIRQKTNLNKKIVYSFYKKGFIKCVKTYNQKFYDHDSDWLMNANQLVSQSINEFSKQKKELDNKMGRIQEIRQLFVCDKCGVSLGFEKATSYNFTCFVCGKLLEQKDNSEKVDSCMKNIEKINQNITFLRENYLSQAQTI